MYKFSDETGLIVSNDTVCNISSDNKREWQKYLTWLSQGNVTEAYITVSDAIETKINEIKEYCDEIDKLPFEYPVGSGVFYKVTSAVIHTYTACLRLDDESPIPCNGGEWDNYDATVSTSFTVSEFKDLYDFGYNIPSTNYTNMKYHIGIVSQLEDVSTIQNYDYSGGWYSSESEE